ncbi:cytochrome c551 peroxidase [Hydrogenimonas sp.]|nr:cytochrome c551 peroxidase [Hydrogenimonas sp.]
MRSFSLFGAVLTGSLMAVTLATPAAAKEDLSKWIRPDTVPAPKNNRITPERIELGKFLYFDTRLSRDNTISCATCHNPALGWSDGEPKAVGIEGRRGPRNSPTVLNTAYQRHQFWDGRAKSLEEQALGPIQADVEMDMDLDKLVERLNGIKGYRELFEKAYPGEGITKDTIAKAIATFERTVVSTEAPFDRYVKGDENAISENAKKGFALFTGKGKCNNCHDGFNFTDGSFHNLGLGDSDIGRYKLKKRAAWFHAFKTPTLRDVTLTAPYFHDGSIKTLEEATAVCGNGGRFYYSKNLSPLIVDRGLTPDEISLIVDFLKTLEGKPMNLEIPTSFPQ